MNEISAFTYVGNNIEKRQTMKLILLISTLLIFTSCQKKVDEVEISNQKNKLEILDRISKIKELNNKFKSDLMETKITQLLDLERLQVDKKQVESERIISNAENVLSDFRSNRKKLSNELLILTDSIKPHSNITNKQIQDLKSNYLDMIKTNYEDFKADSSYVALNKKIVSLLKNICDYDIKDNRIYFETDNCINQFSLMTNWLEASIDYQRVKQKQRELNINGLKK